jgi:peptidoglycan-N-acetylglucosamine deacetylase
MNFASLSDSIFGPCIRKIPTASKTLYLTFDDGPVLEMTDGVLDVLAKHRAGATFFLVAERVRKEAAVSRRILKDGHTIGNHSLDHRYGPFFSSAESLKRWVLMAKTELEQSLGVPTVGFRPPAGVRTPPLRRILSELGEPLVLWDKRCYDSVFSWSLNDARSMLRDMENGTIILLHDRQSITRFPGFIRTLDAFLSEANANGFSFARLDRGVCVELYQKLCKQKCNS